MGYEVDEDILQDFLIEASEILEQLSEQLVDLEKRPNDRELLNAIFRGFHTVKGGAGFLSLSELVDACHGAENVFDTLRNGGRQVDSELMDVIMDATRDAAALLGRPYSISGHVVHGRKLGRALVEASDCLRCHGLERHAVGPGFRQIAARYAGRSDAGEYLAGRIREGSVGVWGRTLMPRHPQITEAQALQILTHSPQIGRPVRGGKRELVIGQSSRGYVALYHYVAAIDTVFVLAVRSQREAGFKR